MCLRGLLIDVPTWLVTGPDPDVGRWLLLEEFPEWRRGRLRDELDAARQAWLAVQGDDDASGTE
jgi:hypothetical protein